MTRSPIELSWTAKKPASQDIWTVRSKFVPFAIAAKVEAAMKELENEDNNLKPQFPVNENF